MYLAKVFRQFSTEKKSKLFFKNQRDKKGIVCKKCKGTEHYWKQDKWQYECKSCQFRTTLRSGTLLEASKLSYQYWMIGMALMTATKKSFSAVEIQRQLGHKRYEPIWLMMQKIRVSMGSRDDKYQLDGFVELDEGFFESQQKKGEQKQPENKYYAHDNKGKRQVKVLVAAESEPVKKKHKNKSKPERIVRFIKMKVIDSVAKESVNYEVQTNIAPTAQVITDGRRCYADLKDSVAQHEVVICEDKKEVSKIFPWVHIAISNAKKMCLGIHHSIQRCYMQNYLNEFCYKFNRRYFGEKLLDRLLIAAVEAPWYQVRYVSG